MEVFDKFYERYDEWYDKNRDVFLKEVEVVKKIRFSGFGIEIGVGTGRFAHALGVEYGIDTSFNMLLKAKERGIKVLNAQAENIPFKDEIFDFALIIVTICFVKNPLMVLKETKRILKDNGKVVVGIIDKESVLGKLYQKKESPFYKEANFYSPKDILIFFKETGFSYDESYQLLIPYKDEILPGFGEGSFVVLSGIKK
ncbi:MAG: SAM-dependent methyltransferase [Caldiserica bacterium]|nr:MAG: SAM-dependent methyltransferase [Caldisericota bacterium]